MPTHPQCGAPTTFDADTIQLVCDHWGAAQPIQVASGTIATHDLFGKTSITSMQASQQRSRAQIRELAATRVPPTDCCTHACQHDRA
ncbi:MAG: hypothetical protein ABI467_17755 [Kofleriaceae bacterium]